VFANRVGHVFKHVDIRQQGATLEQHAHAHPQPVERLPVECRHLLSEHPHRARQRTQLAADDLQQGRLAGTAGPHDRGHLARRDDEVDAIEDQPLAMGKPQVPNLYNWFRHGAESFLYRMNEFHSGQLQRRTPYAVCLVCARRRV
jgi:hypothetical protein